LPVTDNTVGIDLGVTSLIATSNGDKIANPQHFKKHCKRLKKAQKNLSRKQKGSRACHQLGGLTLVANNAQSIK
jgi:putative transposase